MNAFALLNQAESQLHQSRVNRTHNEDFLSRLELAEKRDSQHSHEVKDAVSSQVAAMVAAKKARRAHGVAQADDSTLTANWSKQDARANQREAYLRQHAAPATVTLDGWQRAEPRESSAGSIDNPRMLQGASAAARGAAQRACNSTCAVLSTAGNSGGQVLGGVLQSSAPTAGAVRDLVGRARERVADGMADALDAAENVADAAQRHRSRHRHRDGAAHGQSASQNEHRHHTRSHGSPPGGGASRSSGLGGAVSRQDRRDRQMLSLLEYL